MDFIVVFLCLVFQVLNNETIEIKGRNMMGDRDPPRKKSAAEPSSDFQKWQHHQDQERLERLENHRKKSNGMDDDEYGQTDGRSSKAVNPETMSRSKRSPSVGRNEAGNLAEGSRAESVDKQMKRRNVLTKHNNRRQQVESENDVDEQ